MLALVSTDEKDNNAATEKQLQMSLSRLEATQLEYMNNLMRIGDILGLHSAAQKLKRQSQIPEHLLHYFFCQIDAFNLKAIERIIKNATSYAAGGS